MQPNHNNNEYYDAAEAQIAFEMSQEEAIRRAKFSLKFWTSFIQWFAGICVLCILFYEFFAFGNHLQAGTSITNIGTWGIIIFAIICVVLATLASYMAD